MKVNISSAPLMDNIKKNKDCWLMPGPEQILKYKAGLTCICLVNFKHELNLVHLFLSVANSWYSACWTRNTD